MSYALGQSQTPWDVSISEVDLPANMHFNRWGPVSGMGQMPNPMDFIQQFLPGNKTVTPVAEDPMKKVLPIVLVGAAAVGLWWYLR